MNTGARLRTLLPILVLIAASIAARARAESLYAPATCHEVSRAGHPRQIAHWAQPQNPCAYDGYFVGDRLHSYHEFHRCHHRGTWGWDYTGRFLKRSVHHGGTHLPHDHGGTGSYEPDGPRLLH
jgi:hypothetical protein